MPDLVSRVLSRNAALFANSVYEGLFDDTTVREALDWATDDVMLSFPGQERLLELRSQPGLDPRTSYILRSNS